MKIRKLLAVVMAAGVMFLSACAASTQQSGGGNGLVVVAGATGGTGRALVRNLQDQGYAVRAFVRDTAKARVVLGDEVDYVQGDVRDIDSIRPAMTGATYVISAIGAGRSDPDNGPEHVDFGGVKNLTDAAVEAGVKQFVLVSSSGVTQEDHFLNKVMNNVLIWKFKGEEALRNSGMPYTIVRPGGLVNTPGGDEALVFAQGDTTTGRISREDVALICIAALGNPAALGKTFETYSSEESGANDWSDMFSALQAD
ncbi:MAG: SDR family oxidoreductase [Gammaproteobacteria bacterium]|nr:SDR family oxidoreductase [Gammaproteobacteria bacterium]